MISSATSIEAYLGELPDDRKEALAAVLATIRKNLPKGYEEVVGSYGISFQVPLKVYPDTYNKQPLMYAALASQKSHMALYLCSVYASDELRADFEAGWKAAGKKLDMGKSCVRFKKLSELPLEVIGKAIAAMPMDAYVAHAKAANSKEARAERSAARKTAAAK